MLLDNKVAVIYGGGGAIGGAMARAFAREGARIFVAGRTQDKLDMVVNDIRAQGGAAEATVVDALDQQAVETFVNRVAEQAGRIDISVNVIGVGDVQKPLLEITLEEFMQPITIAMRSHFVTSRAVAPHMIKNKSGVILSFGGSGPQTQPGLGGFKVALDAIEGLRRQWAMELGEHNIRVVTLKSGGVPETITSDDPAMKEISEMLVDMTLLKRAATLADVGNVAVFVVSDKARTITSTEVNISAGAIVD